MPGTVLSTRDTEVNKTISLPTCSVVHLQSTEHMASSSFKNKENGVHSIFSRGEHKGILDTTQGV